MPQSGQATRLVIRNADKQALDLHILIHERLARDKSQQCRAKPNPSPSPNPSSTQTHACIRDDTASSVFATDYRITADCEVNKNYTSLHRNGIKHVLLMVRRNFTHTKTYRSAKPLLSHLAARYIFSAVFALSCPLRPFQFYKRI